MACCVAFSGYSGSGKTRLIRALVERFSARNSTVAVIKHTHHIPGELWRGDTLEFLQAGATAVVLATDDTAIMMSRGGRPAPGPGLWPVDAVSSRPELEVRRGAYSEPTELCAALGADLILIEGFRSETRWPRVVVARREVLARESHLMATDPLGALLGIPNVVALVSDTRISAGIPQFTPEDVDGIAEFVGRICA